MKLEVKKSSLDHLETDTLVVFVSQQPPAQTKKKSAAPGAKVQIHGVSRAILAKINAAVTQGAVTGTASEGVFFREAHAAGARHLLTIGLGDSRNLQPETLRQAAASIVSNLKCAKSRTAAIALESLPHNSLTGDSTLQALTEGLLLSNYAFVQFKENKNPDGIERIQFVTPSKAKSFEKGLEIGTTIAECVNFGRWLGDHPGNRMTPATLADETVKAAKGSKLKVNIWDKARIKQEKMGAFMGVAVGSAQDPRFIIMEYTGTSTSKKPICFVGKGLTFDTGGISIKPAGGMEEMKYDMCGGANVIATMLAIARLKLKVNAIGLVPATENMPGGAALKPGDILYARNGKTIEVNNTDAEGRLILADALVYACEQKPAMIIDAATLTGAMVVALGNLHTGVFTRNSKLLDRIQKAADTTGEWIWQMPLTDMHARDMRGTYADLSNMSSAGRNAGSATAAAFLEQFIDKDIPWIHCDIAGTGWHTGDRLPYCPRKGASGVMIRTFVQLAIDHE